MVHLCPPFRSGRSFQKGHKPFPPRPSRGVAVQKSDLHRIKGADGRRELDKIRGAISDRGNKFVRLNWGGKGAKRVEFSGTITVLLINGTASSARIKWLPFRLQFFFQSSVNSHCK